MADRPDAAGLRSLEPEPLHRLKNHLAIVISFSDLLLQELDPSDPHRADVEEINKAGREAAALVAGGAGNLKL